MKNITPEALVTTDPRDDDCDVILSFIPDEECREGLRSLEIMGIIGFSERRCRSGERFEIQFGHNDPQKLAEDAEKIAGWVGRLGPTLVATG